MRHHKKIAAGLLASVLVLAGCTAAGAGEASSTESSSIVSSSSETTATQEETVASAATASSEATVSSGTTESVADVDWSSLPTTEVTLTDEGLTITEAGTYVLTGTSTRQVTVASDGNVRIILDGVTINSTTGAAIQVDSAELTVLSWPRAAPTPSPTPRPAATRRSTARSTPPTTSSSPAPEP